MNGPLLFRDLSLSTYIYIYINFIAISPPTHRNIIYRRYIYHGQICTNSCTYHRFFFSLRHKCARRASLHHLLVRTAVGPSYLQMRSTCSSPTQHWHYYCSRCIRRGPSSSLFPGRDGYWRRRWRRRRYKRLRVREWQRVRPSDEGQRGAQVSFYIVIAKFGGLPSRMRDIHSIKQRLYRQ